MSILTMLYDPDCGLCRRVQGWLSEQPKLIEIRMIPIKTDAARCRFPQLNHELTGEDLTVISDQGAVYFGPKAWLMVLWALAPVSRMVLPAGFARVVADNPTSRVPDLSTSLSDQPGCTFIEVIR